MSVAFLLCAETSLRLQAGICPRQGSNFLLLRQKKVTKEKASRRQGPCGLPCAARAEGEPRNLALRAQTCASLDPLVPALLGPANGGKSEPPTAGSQQGRAMARPCGVGSSVSGSRCRVRRRVAQGRAEIEAQMFEPAGRVSALPALAEQRSVPCAQRRDDAPGSPFFWVLCFGEAKKSTSPAGARPGRQPRGGLTQLEMSPTC